MTDWTDEEMEQLRHMRSFGLSLSECARRLGRTRNSVSSRWRRGPTIRWRPTTPEQRSKMLIVFGRGGTVREAREAAGVAKKTAEEWRARWRARGTLPPAPPPRRPAILCRALEGTPARDVAQQLGCSVRWVQQVAREAREEGLLR